MSSEGITCEDIEGAIEMLDRQPRYSGWACRNPFTPELIEEAKRGALRLGELTDIRDVKVELYKTEGKNPYRLRLVQTEEP